MNTAQTRRTSFLNLANWQQPLQVCACEERGRTGVRAGPEE